MIIKTVKHKCSQLRGKKQQQKNPQTEPAIYFIAKINAQENEKQPFDWELLRTFQYKQLILTSNLYFWGNFNIVYYKESHSVKFRNYTGLKLGTPNVKSFFNSCKTNYIFFF